MHLNDFYYTNTITTIMSHNDPAKNCSCRGQTQGLARREALPQHVRAQLSCQKMRAEWVELSLRPCRLEVFICQDITPVMENRIEKGKSNEHFYIAMGYI